jgi:hypothetical protein
MAFSASETLFEAHFHTKIITESSPFRNRCPADPFGFAGQLPDKDDTFMTILVLVKESLNNGTCPEHPYPACHPERSEGSPGPLGRFFAAERASASQNDRLNYKSTLKQKHSSPRRFCLSFP